MIKDLFPEDAAFHPVWYIISSAGLGASCKTSAVFVLLKNIFSHLSTHKKTPKNLILYAVSNDKGVGSVPPFQNLISGKAHTRQKDGHATQF